MAQTALSPNQLTRTALRLKPRAGALAGIAALFCAAAFWNGPGLAAQAFGLIGGTLVSLIGAVHVVIWVFRQTSRRARRTLADFVSHDAAACFVTDQEGEIWYLNAAAERRFDGDAVTLAGLLGDVFANPGAVLHRLRERAEKAGAAREDVVTRRGTMRLSTHRLEGRELLWRLEEIADRGVQGGEPPRLPMLTIGRNGAVLFMNEPARRLIGQRIKTLERLFPVEPPVSGQINEVKTVDGKVSCFVFERDRPGARREILLLPAALREAEERVTTSNWADVEALPVPLLKISTDGKILRSNRLARDLLGQQDCAGKHLATLLEGLGRSLGAWLTEVATGREAHCTEFLRVKRDDREVFAQVTLKRSAEPDGGSLIAVLNDATELKMLEAQFVQSQKMQAIGELAGGVAHDFNNLLTAISGYCDLLLLRHDQGDPDFCDLVQINQNANRAAGLVGQLLAYSRKQTLQFEVLDLRDTVSDLTHLLNRLVGEKVVLSLSHDPVLQAIRADKRQLEQVIMNIVVNARDAMPAGGEIRIETRNRHFDAPSVRDRATIPAGEYVSIMISDEGVGIPPDKLEKIFEPFFTTKNVGEGTGLGLSTAYGIVKQTGGFIFSDSVPGEGTQFTMLFPVYAGATDAAVQRETATSFAPAKHMTGDLSESDAAGQVGGATLRVKVPGDEQPDGGVVPGDAGAHDPVMPHDADETVVLLVEDEAPVRAFASRALRMRGYTVFEAGTAEDALHILEDDALSVDIFVTDVVMPGMDGPSWVRKALEQRPGVRVVFVSGYAEDVFGEGREAIPNSVFLPKPFSLSELTGTIKQQLH
ncbi:ATP-binding protein [Aquicoccus sp. G2-2]|uniref:hybrid sensor histidine kinase/response regulator n=1 Tax=Aquicoccus sp. G2-2 TaxID=3092120 RepID=UPI002ADF6AF6|nr:ATP-binding protein [Aquicoccus sp. G2-2]MEA1113389.1 ATP-binding protein [Aquicoccus sp. G2-2]